MILRKSHQEDVKRRKSVRLRVIRYQGKKQIRQPQVKGLCSTRHNDESAQCWLWHKTTNTDTLPLWSWFVIAASPGSLLPFDWLPHRNLEEAQCCHANIRQGQRWRGGSREWCVTGTEYFMAKMVLWRLFVLASCRLLQNHADKSCGSIFWQHLYIFYYKFSTIFFVSIFQFTDCLNCSFCLVCNPDTMAH